MLQMEWRKPDLWAPIFVCDWCGKKIERAEEGMYQFWMHLEGYPHNPILVTTHKGAKQCNRYWEKAHEQEGYLHGWMPLTNLMGYLINNLGLDWEKMVEAFAPEKTYKKLIKRSNRSRKEYYPEVGKRI